MLRNYLKIALRNIRKSKAYFFINISGLAIGVASCILIFLFIQDELRYDRYHEKADHIFRVTEELSTPGQKRYMAITPAPFAPTMEREFKEVVHAVRFMPGDFNGEKVLITQGNDSYYEDKWFFVDENVFSIFSFPLVKGLPKSALKEPFSVVISQKAAQKIFGDQNPIGKVITLNNRFFKDDFKITGIFMDIPGNSHFTFNFLASFVSVEVRLGRWLENWFNHMYYTYLLLEDEADPDNLEKKFPEMIEKYTGKMGKIALIPHLQPLTSIHLYSHLENEIDANGDILYVYIFSTVAVFILIIACINFINLATARSSSRAREVGMRKVMGAYRSHLIKQFLGECFLFTLIAILMAVVIAGLLLPAFNAVADKELHLDVFKTWSAFGILIILTFTVTLLSGMYPALFLSAFKPARTLKKSIFINPRSPALRKGLIVFQFSVSIALIIFTLGVMNQLKYIRTKRLGFNKDNVVVLPLRDDFLKKRSYTIKNELIQSPKVQSASASSGLPGRIPHHWILRAEGFQSQKQRPTAWVLMVDHDYIKTMGLEIIEGRNLSEEFTSDEKQGIIINESAAVALGWESPLGKNIKTENMDGFVIGVVRDFHFKSFHQQIEPLIIYIYPEHFAYLSVRIGQKDIPASLEFIKRKWKELAPNYPFDYFFLDSDFDRFYHAEQRVGRIFSGFSLLAVIIATLGLFGLASYMAEKRTKEIGIRKVLGASEFSLVFLLSREFTKWVLVSNLLAWPISFYAIRSWLQNFVYRAETSLWMFFLASTLAVIIAAATVSFQTIRSALSNPVDSLRYE